MKLYMRHAVDLSVSPLPCEGCRSCIIHDLAEGDAEPFAVHRLTMTSGDACCAVMASRWQSIMHESLAQCSLASPCASLTCAGRRQQPPSLQLIEQQHPEILDLAQERCVHRPLIHPTVGSTPDSAQQQHCHRSFTP